MNPAISFLKKNTDYYQINTIEEHQEEVVAENNILKLFNIGDNTKVVLQCWKDGKHATVHGSAFTLAMAKQAAKLAKLSDRKEYFYGLPDKHPPSAYGFARKGDVFFRSPPERLLEIARDVLHVVHDDVVDVASLSVTRIGQDQRVQNSQGVDVRDRINTLSLSVQATAEHGKSTYWDGVAYPFLFDYRKLARHVKEHARLFLSLKKIQKKQARTLPVTLSPDALSSLMQTALIDNFNGQYVEKGKSIFQDRLGEKVFGNISLVDDGTLQEGILSGKMDFEGMPKQRTPLVKRGIVEHFVYDYNTATHNHTSSTGNADVTGINTRDLVLTGPSGKIDDTIYVDTIMGAHTANALTTAFSVKAEKAYILRKGEKIPLAPFMISGRMLDVLNHVLAIGKQVQYRNTLLSGPLMTKKIAVIP